MIERLEQRLPLRAFGAGLLASVALSGAMANHAEAHPAHVGPAFTTELTVPFADLQPVAATTKDDDLDVLFPVDLPYEGKILTMDRVTKFSDIAPKIGAYTNSACLTAGSELTRIVRQEDMDFTEENGETAHAWGRAYQDGTCRRELSERLGDESDYLVCKVKVHEDLHTYGLGHSGNRKDIMYSPELDSMGEEDAFSLEEVPFAPCAERTIDLKKQSLEGLTYDAALYSIPAFKTRSVFCPRVPKTKWTRLCIGTDESNENAHPRQITIKRHHTKGGVPQFKSKVMPKKLPKWFPKRYL